MPAFPEILVGLPYDAACPGLSQVFLALILAACTALVPDTEMRRRREDDVAATASIG